MTHTPEGANYEDVFFGTDISHAAVQALRDYRKVNPAPAELKTVEYSEKPTVKPVSDAEVAAAFE